MGLPANAAYTTEGTCDFACDREFYYDGAGVTCEACTVQCGAGLYVVGECTSEEDATCGECTNAPANATYLAVVGAGTSECPFECDAPRFFSAGTLRCDLCPVAEDCVSGWYLGGECSPTTRTGCVECTNEIPAGAEYSGSGGEANECPFRCSPGFFFEEATGTCDACRVVEECEDGESLGGQCSHESNPTCNECTDIPANADPIDSVCGWVCATNYTQNAEGTACVACRTSCEAGMYLSGACSNVEAPVCRVCTGAPANAAYTSAGSDGVDDCEFVCGEALYYSVGTNQCLECTVRGDCAVGQVMFGVCGNATDARCGVCPGEGLPANAAYSTEGTCDFACNREFYYDGAGVTCEACTVQCGAGLYVVGECTSEEDATCGECTNAPANATYLAVVGAGTSECPFECDAPRFFSGETLRCDMCPVAEDCVSGEYLGGECSRTTRTGCVECTNEIPAGAEYSGSGGEADECPFPVQPRILL